MTSVDVTVSIVNHESRDAVLESLRLLAADTQRRARLQVLVVDNVSQDGSVEAIRAAFPDVEVLVRDERHGFGANHNVAIARARGRHVLLLNDDAQVRPGAIDALVAHLDAQPGVAIAAPQVVDHAGQPQPSAWPLPSMWQDLRSAVTLGRAAGAVTPAGGPRAVGWAMGCALLVRRAALERVGGFDEGYFMYSEEIDLAARLAAAGLATHVVPAAVVVHEGQASTGGHQGPERAVEMARSRRRYWERHYGPVQRRVAQAATSAAFAALAAASAVLRRPARAFWLQARECWRPTGAPGLRERAAAFNGGLPASGAAPAPR